MSAHRHLVIIAHPDDELVFMSPAMLSILRGPDAVKIVYLTAGDAAQDERYWRSRERAIAQTHAALRPSKGALADRADTAATLAPEPARRGVPASPVAPVAPVTLEFLRLADGMLQGQGAPNRNAESLIKLWRGDIVHMHALDGGARYTREALIAHLQQTIAAFAPTLLHTLNGVAKDAHEHADHHATGLFAAAAAIGCNKRLTVRLYIGSNSPRMPANVTGAALADKIAVFASYAQHDTEIFNGRPDWLTSSIYAPMLEREYSQTCNSGDMHIDGDTIVV